MKYTLLELTQAVMSSIDADEINSINDTVEAQQVVNLIRTAYMDIVIRADLPEHYGIVNLESSEDGDQPILMTVPSDVDKVYSIKYDCIANGDTAPFYREMQYLPILDFLDRCLNLDEDETNIDSMEIVDGVHSFTILYANDQAPSCWTSYNDRTILFDSYDSTVDSVLQSSKTLCMVRKIIPWENSNTFIPVLDDSQFPLLLNEAKSLAWAELRQSPNQKIEQSARRNWTHLQRTKYNVTKPEYFESLPNFGRK